MSARISKKPEERKQELIDIASELFEEYGYERVSVRDILAKANGAPGMFYYYFASKQDIFLACMESYFLEKLKIKMDILQDQSISYRERIKTLRDIIVKDISDFVKKYDFSKNNSITDNSYRLWELTQYIGRFVEPYADFILEGIQKHEIKNRLGINEKNVKCISAFVLYGAMGSIYGDSIHDEKEGVKTNEAFEIISKIFD